MKIPYTHPNVEVTTVARDAARTPVTPAPNAGADAVRLSGDLQLADRAVRAAVEDEGRSDVVERLREMHERGELSVDTERLADRMIDALIHSHDDTP